jgi:hypothetical protein
LPGKGGCVEEGLKPTPSCVDVGIDQISAYLLGWIVGDGGLYKLSYSGGRTEYRVVVTQKDLSTATRCLAPLFESLCSMLNVTSKVRVIPGSTRVEVRASSKLYEHFTSLLTRLPEFTESERRLFIAGFYMAEGEKSGRRVRMWNKDIQLLKLIGSWLREFGIEKFSIYLDDKRHGVYVLEIPSRYRHLFFNIWGLETPCDLY